MICEFHKEAPSANPYSRSVDLLLDFADSKGLNISPEEIARWSGIMEVMRIVDKKIDSLGRKEDRQKEYSKIFGCIESGDVATIYGTDREMNSAAMKAVEIFNQISPPQKDKFKRSLMMIFVANEMIKSTQDVNELATARRIEGQSSSRLLESLLEESTLHDPNWPSFRKILKLLGRTGNTVDLYVDWNEDLNANLLQVPPTFQNRLKMGNTIMDDAMKLLSQLQLRDYRVVSNTITKNRLWRVIGIGR